MASQTTSLGGSSKPPSEDADLPSETLPLTFHWDVVGTKCPNTGCCVAIPLGSRHELSMGLLAEP